MRPGLPGKPKTRGAVTDRHMPNLPTIIARFRPCLLIFICCALLSVPGIPGSSAHAETLGRIIASRLNVREQPGIGHRIVATLSRGDTVTVLDTTDEWLRVRHGERIGWVRNRDPYIRILTPGEAAAVEAAARDHVKQERESIQRKIEAGAAEVVSYTQSEAAVIGTLNEIDRSLNDAMVRRKALETELGQLKQKIDGTQADVARLSEAQAETRAYASRRLVALYKLSRIGHVHLLASAGSIHELFLRENTLSRILDNDIKLLRAMASNRRELNRLLAVQHSQQAALTELDAELRQQVGRMAAQKARKAELLEEVRSRKSLQMAALEALRESASQLDEKIRNLDVKPVQREPDITLPDKPFAELKGLLKMPVEGRIVSTFGPYRNRQFNVVNFRSGIDIQADRGEPIRSVFIGRVVYANWFKGYGNMIIIDHGDGFHTVYANAEELFKKTGDTVQTGEVVATVGETGSDTGTKLHFEIRHDRKPVDPLQWIEKG